MVVSLLNCVFLASNAKVQSPARKRHAHMKRLASTDTGSKHVAASSRLDARTHQRACPNLRCFRWRAAMHCEHLLQGLCISLRSSAHRVCWLVALCLVLLFLCVFLSFVLSCISLSREREISLFSFVCVS